MTRNELKALRSQLWAEAGEAMASTPGNLGFTERRITWLVQVASDSSQDQTRREAAQHLVDGFRSKGGGFKELMEAAGLSWHRTSGEGEP